MAGSTAAHSNSGATIESRKRSRYHHDSLWGSGLVTAATRRTDLRFPSFLCVPPLALGAFAHLRLAAGCLLFRKEP